MCAHALHVILWELKVAFFNACEVATPGFRPMLCDSVVTYSLWSAEN